MCSAFSLVPLLASSAFEIISVPSGPSPQFVMSRWVKNVLDFNQKSKDATPFGPKALSLIEIFYTGCSPRAVISVFSDLGKSASERDTNILLKSTYLMFVSLSTTSLAKNWQASNPYELPLNFTAVASGFIFISGISEPFSNFWPKSVTKTVT
jgi:hypothetical protein